MTSLSALRSSTPDAAGVIAPTSATLSLADPPAALTYFAWRTAVNSRRYVDGLRPFRPGEFGSGPSSPSAAHLDAVNRMIGAARLRQEREERKLALQARDVLSGGDGARNALLTIKERSETLARETEQVWEFYLNMFGQRTGPFAAWLGALDRVALDCYQAVYLGLGRARSIPSPSPFSYMETGFGPATFRRGVRLARLGRQPNPFPLVKIPYHRLLNPWSLGAVPHEVAHNLQSDLGLWEVMPDRIGAQFKRKGLPPRNAAVWQRWHKETYADLAGVLLIGPAYVGSLMDVVGRSRESSAAWNDEAVHPTPIIRVPLGLRLLERIGFGGDARAFRRAWDALYPRAAWEPVPAWVRARLDEQIDAVLDAICFQRFDQYGGKALCSVVRFEPKHASLVREAAERLQVGMDTGVLPERFLIAAVRQALAWAKTPPEVLARNFYAALGRG